MMVKYLHKISLMVCMLSFMSSNISASDIKEEGDYKLPIKFKSFVYDPNTKSFEGDFFQETENIARQFGGFYTEKYKKVTYEDLPQAQEKLKYINSAFNKEELNQLKLQKLKFKEEGTTLETQDLERYKVLKKQEDEFILQESIVESLQAQSKKYDRRRIAMTDMGVIFQKIFYIEMLQPQSIITSSYFYYISKIEEMRELKLIDLSGSADKISSKFKPEDIEGTDLNEMKKRCDYIFNFLKEYIYKLHNEEARRIDHGRRCLENQRIIDSNKFSNVLNLLKLNGSFSNKDISELVNYFEIKELRKEKKQMENKVRPLANLYLSFFKNLESFQKEIVINKK
ncbi:MAG: hypothetical protein JNK42_05590 [Caedimonas sp.]|jgi:hypothetical protein|nr:hypothetical protein [Caedimonas sp.]